MATAKNRTCRVVKEPGKEYDIDKLDKFEMRSFARATLQATERYFQIPGVQEDFERWLREDYSKRPGVELSEVYKNKIYKNEKRNNRKRNQGIHSEAK